MKWSLLQFEEAQDKQGKETNIADLDNLSYFPNLSYQWHCGGCNAEFFMEGEKVDCTKKESEEHEGCQSNDDCEENQICRKQCLKGGLNLSPEHEEMRNTRKSPVL